MTSERTRRPSVLRSGGVSLLAHQPVWSALITVMLAALAWGVIGPYYDSTDDVLLRLGIEGQLTPAGKPSSLLVHLHPAIAVILVELTLAAPGIPWYDVFMGGMAAATIAIVIYTVSGDRAVDRILVAGLGIVYLLPLLTRVQYTAIAELTAGAGALTILSSVVRLSAPLRRGPTIAGSLLIAVSFFIRLEAALFAIGVVLLLAAPMLLADWREVRASWRRLCISVIVVGACAALALLSEEYLYDQRSTVPGVKEHATYRMGLTEYFPVQRRATELPNLLRESDWTSADYAMLDIWFGTDADVFSLSRMRAAYHAVHSDDEDSGPPLDLNLVSATLSELIPRLFSTLLVAITVFLAWRPWTVPSFVTLAMIGVITLLGLSLNVIDGVLLVLVALVLLTGGNGLARYGVYSLVTLTILLGVLGAVTKVPPWRIYFPLFALAAALLVFIIGRYRLRPYRVGMLLAGGVALVVGLMQVTEMVQTVRTQSAARTDLRRATEAHVEGPDLAFMIHPTGGFRPEIYWQPFQASKAPWRMMPINWTNYTPAVQDYLQDQGVQHLAYSLCSDARFRLVASETILPIIAEYIREHHGASAQFTRAPIDSSIAVYRCSLATPMITGQRS